MIDPKVLEQLRAIGIDVPPEGGAVWLNLKPVDPNTLPHVREQRAALEKIRDHLRAELDDTLAKIDAAHEQRERAKNGGGV